MYSNTLLVGWSSVDITPSRKVSIQGQYHERISEGVHDPIYATALAIESKEMDLQNEHALMISCDLVGIEKVMLDKLREN